MKLTFTQSTISKFKIRSFFILFLCIFISGCGQLSLKENPETLKNQQTSHYAKSEFNRFESPNQYTYGEDKDSSNLTFNTANKNEMDVVMSLVIFIFLIVIFGLSNASKISQPLKASKIKPHPYWKEKEEEAPQVATETIQLKKVRTSLMLKRDEVAYFEINSTLSETRAERRHQSVFAGRRQKNTFFGGSSGRSKSHQVLTDIDSGLLILTNKRLVFDGKETNRTIKLNKIMSVDIETNFWSSDQLEMSVEGRQKSMYFSVSDTDKYKKLIMLAWQNV